MGPILDNLRVIATCEFDLLIYLEFMALLLFFGPLIYRPMGGFLGWELGTKGFPDHYEDYTHQLVFGTVLFIAGNYANTFNYITASSYPVGMFLFGLLGELSFLKVAVPGYCGWKKKAWAVMIMGLLLVLGATGYHLYLGHQKDILGWYLGGFWIVVSHAFIFPFIVLKLEKRRVEWAKDLYQGCQKCLGRCWSSRGQPVAGSEILSEETPPQEKIYAFHLHHWQIFYVLAFFTRFDDVASQICAGLVLGIYGQGVAQYGYGSVFTD